jgi:hypothetical protein
MASIIQIGERWRAQVRRRHHKPQTRTFRTKREAEAWARGIESRIDAGAEPKSAAALRVSEMIREYRRLREEGGRPIEPTTNVHYMLVHLDEDLGGEAVVGLTPARLAKWASAPGGDRTGDQGLSADLVRSPVD